MPLNRYCRNAPFRPDSLVGSMILQEADTIQFVSMVRLIAQHEGGPDFASSCNFTLLLAHACSTASSSSSFLLTLGRKVATPDIMANRQALETW